MIIHVFRMKLLFLKSRLLHGVYPEPAEGFAMAVV